MVEVAGPKTLRAVDSQQCSNCASGECGHLHSPNAQFGFLPAVQKDLSEIPWFTHFFLSLNFPLNHSLHALVEKKDHTIPNIFPILTMVIPLSSLTMVVHSIPLTMAVRIVL
jgi:hypothetical protein